MGLEPIGGPAVRPGVSWWLVDIVCRALDARERQVVQGDLAELAPSGARALCEVVGLAVRRQAALWKDWRPWLALLGIVGPAGVGFIYFSSVLHGSYELYSWILQNYSTIDPDILEDTGLTLRRGIPRVISCFVLLVSWSWTGGFAMASLARRSAWLHGALLCGVWVGLAISARPAPGRLWWLFLLLFLWGMRQGLRRGCLRLRSASWLVALLAAIIALGIWAGGWFPAGVWHARQLSLAIVLSWPAWYLFAIAFVRNRPVTVHP